jgi:predicted transcriptional regulator
MAPGKLSKEQIRSLIAMRQRHVSIREIADAFFVTPAAIMHHCNAAGVVVTKKQAQARVELLRRQKCALL